MGNRKVTLIRICKTEKGWRRHPAAIGRNGKIRPGYAVVNGEQVHFPEGRYELRMYEGSKPVYRSLGNSDAQEALSALHRESHLHAVRGTARAAGITVEEAETKESKHASLNKKRDEFSDRLKSMGHKRASETFIIACDDFTQATGVKLPHEITEDSILEFYRALRRKGNSDRTIYNKHVSMFAFFKWMKLDTKKLAARPPRYTEREVETYDPDELRQFFSACDEYQNVVFQTYLKTGMRMQEGMFLEWANINFRGKVIKVRERLDGDPGEKVSIKDRAERSIPFPDDLSDLLLRWKDKRPKTRYVLGTENDTPNWKMLRTMKRVAKRAGLNCGVCSGCRGRWGECGRWKLKTLRSTYTTTMLRNGVDPRTLMSWTGHEDLETILKYLSPSRDPKLQQVVSNVVWM